MTNVSKLPNNKELRNVSYTEGFGFTDDDIGVSTVNREIGITRLNDKDFLIVTPEGDGYLEQLIDRETLAEFLHVASVFVDSEKRHYPEVDLIGCDYK